LTGIVLCERNTEAEEAAIKEGRVPEAWQAKPARLRQKDRDARWSVKYTKAKVKQGADPKAFKPVDLAIPMFGYKNHIGIDRAHGLIRTWDASAANAHDGARLPELVSRDNTAAGVWADTAYRSKKNEAFLAKGMFVSNIHQKKPPRRLMPKRTARANAKRSAVALRGRARVRWPEAPHGAPRAHHRHRAGPHQNRDDEPRL
jgi:transposase, IS5 family